MFVFGFPGYVLIGVRVIWYFAMFCVNGRVGGEWTRICYGQRLVKGLMVILLFRAEGFLSYFLLVARRIYYLRVRGGVLDRFVVQAF